MKKSLTIILALTVLAAPALAADEPSVAEGMRLFGSSALGTSGKSCASCHPGGNGLDEAASYDEKDLGKIINNCISKPLKGKELAADSADLKSLVMYIKSLGKADKNR